MWTRHLNDIQDSKVCLLLFPRIYTRFVYCLHLKSKCSLRKVRWFFRVSKQMFCQSYCEMTYLWSSKSCFVTGWEQSEGSSLLVLLIILGLWSKHTCRSNKWKQCTFKQVRILCTITVKAENVNLLWRFPPINLNFNITDASVQATNEPRKNKNDEDSATHHIKHYT